MRRLCRRHIQKTLASEVEWLGEVTAQIENQPCLSR